MGIPPSAGITGDARPSSPLWKDTETQRGAESEDRVGGFDLSYPRVPGCRSVCTVLYPGE